MPWSVARPITPPDTHQVHPPPPPLLTPPPRAIAYLVQTRAGRFMAPLATRRGYVRDGWPASCFGVDPALPPHPSPPRHRAGVARPPRVQKTPEGGRGWVIVAPPSPPYGVPRHTNTSAPTARGLNLPGFARPAAHPCAGGRVVGNDSYDHPLMAMPRPPPLPPSCHAPPAGGPLGACRLVTSSPRTPPPRSWPFTLPKPHAPEPGKPQHRGISRSQPLTSRGPEHIKRNAIARHTGNLDSRGRV